MGSTLLRKVWDLHTVRRLPTGQTQLLIGLHLVHEVTSPQAFDMLRLRGQRVAFPDRTFATVDHIVPTDGQPRPFADGMAVHETVLSFDDFRSADEVFLSGNFSKVTPVVEFDGTHYQHGRVTKRMRELYWDWAHSRG